MPAQGHACSGSIHDGRVRKGDVCKGTTFPTMSVYITTGSTTALRTVCSLSSVEGPPVEGGVGG